MIFFSSREVQSINAQVYESIINSFHPCESNMMAGDCGATGLATGATGLANVERLDG